MTQSTVYDWIRAVKSSKVQNARIHEFLSEMLGFTGAHLPQMLSDLRTRYMLTRSACRRFFTDVPQKLKRTELFKRYVWSDLLLRENDYNRKLLQIARDYRQYLDGCIELRVQIMEYRSSWILQDFPAIQSKTMHCLPAHVVCDFLMAKYDFEHDEGKSGHIKYAEEEQKHLYQSIGNFRKQPVKTLWKLFEIYTAKSQDQPIGEFRPISPDILANQSVVEVREGPRPIRPEILANQPIIEVQVEPRPISPNILTIQPIVEVQEWPQPNNLHDLAGQPVIEASEVPQSSHHLAGQTERECIHVSEPISSPDQEGKHSFEPIKVEQQVLQPIAELVCRDLDLYLGEPPVSPATTSTIRALAHGIPEAYVVRGEGFQRPSTYLGVPVPVKRKLTYRDGVGKRSNAACLGKPEAVKRKIGVNGETSDDLNPCKKPRTESYWPAEEASKNKCHIEEEHVKESEYSCTRVNGLDADQDCQPGTSYQEEECVAFFFASNSNTGTYPLHGDDGEKADSFYRGSQEKAQETDSFYWGSQEKAQEMDSFYWGSQEKAQEAESCYWGIQETAQETDIFYWGGQEKSQHIVLDYKIDPAMGTELIDVEAADAEVEMFCSGQHVTYDLQTLYSDEGRDMNAWGCTLEPTKFTTNPGSNARYVPARRPCVQ